AVTNQLSMIRKFAGSAQIVSFFAPYQCGTCGNPFDRLFDCERDADAIREASPPDTKCPNCGGIGQFDDEARSYFAFANLHLGQAVPPEVRAVADELDSQTNDGVTRETVDKTVEDNVTRLRVQSKLGSVIRWKRILDGIEGPLAIDLGGITGLDP